MPATWIAIAPLPARARSRNPDASERRGRAARRPRSGNDDGSYAQRSFIYLDAEARARGQLGKSILHDLHRPRGQRRAEASVFFGLGKRNLLDKEVGQAGSQVQCSGGRDWSTVVMRRDGGVVGF